MFEISDIMFSKKEQSFFTVVNKREEIAEFINIELKNIIDGSQKN